jgi:hypothetical protein
MSAVHRMHVDGIHQASLFSRINGVFSILCNTEPRPIPLNHMGSSLTFSFSSYALSLITVISSSGNYSTKSFVNVISRLISVM